MRRAIVAAIAVVVLLIVALGSYAAGRHSGMASAALRRQPPATVSTTSTVAPTTTVATTTTTTIPPTTTTTIATATVPDAVAAATRCGCSALPRQILTEAGFVAQLVPVSSDACYFNSPITGPRSWNSGTVIEQSPYAGTVAPVGSTVDLQVCAGQPTVHIG